MKYSLTYHYKPFLVVASLLLLLASGCALGKNTSFSAGNAFKKDSLI